MATNTLPDVLVTNTQWTEIFTATGITAGSNIVVQNKGSMGVIIQTNTANTPPALSDTSGYALGPYQAAKITAESYVFVRAGGVSASLHVEGA